MILHSDSNPYKKLLENNDDSYYEEVMKAIAEFFESKRDDINEYVQTPEYIRERYTEYLSLEAIGYDIKKVDYSSFEEKYQEFLPEKSIDPEIVNDFIKQNIKDNYDQGGYHSLQDFLEFIFSDEDDYYVLGNFYSGTEDYDIEINTDDEIIIRSHDEIKNLFEAIREIPEDIFDKLFDKYFGYIGIYDFKYQLKEIRVDHDTVHKYVTLQEVGSDYTGYSVGIKKSTFNDYFVDWLREEGLMGVKSPDNTVWEEE